MTTTTSDAGKIPVWAMVKASYLAVLENGQAFKRVLVLSTIPLLLCSLVVAWYCQHWIELTDAKEIAKLSGWPWFARNVAPQIWMIAYMAIIGVGAVIWHRALLLCDRPNAASLVHRSVSYFITTIVLSLWWIIPLALFTLWSIDPDSATPAAEDASAAAASAGDRAACLICLSILAGAVLLLSWPLALLNRLALALPAVALGDRTVGWRAVWTATRGNTFRLFVVLLSNAIPLTAIYCLLAYLFPAPAAGVGLVLHTTFFTLLTTVTALVGVGALSYSYRHFFPDLPDKPHAA